MPAHAWVCAFLPGVQGDMGCAGMLGVPRPQPLNDYRLIFMVKKGLDQYMANNKVRRCCVAG